MNRRAFVRGCQAAALVALPGCGEYVGNEPPKRQVELRELAVEELDGGYRLSIEVWLDDRTGDVVRDVELLAYADDGRLVCREHVGTLQTGGRSTAAVEVRCSSFPTIVTMETATSVCEDVLLEVKYWVDEELATDDTPFGWHTTYRECGEGLPPERFVDRSASPPSNES